MARRYRNIKTTKHFEARIIPVILPKNERQALFIHNIENSNLTVGLGCAGTGKTFIAASMAAKMLLKGEVNRIVLTRPNVSTGRSLGFFPGSIEEKLAPWLAPCTNVLIQQLGKADYECRLGKSIFVQPLETIRGTSFEDAFIIVDEAQNLSIEEIKAVTTRIGEGCCMVLIGDAAQSDVKRGEDLLKFIRLCKKSGIDVPVVEFRIEDIVRSDIVGQLVRMFYEENL